MIIMSKEDDEVAVTRAEENRYDALAQETVISKMFALALNPISAQR